VHSTGLSIIAEWPASRATNVGSDLTLVLNPSDAWAVRATQV
jgi:hypothetical protein